MRYPFFSLSTLSVLVLLSCAPSRNLARLTTLPHEDILRKIHERNASISTLEAEGTLTIENPENSSSTGFELQMKRPDSLWMKFTGPFGIVWGMLMLSRERFVFYNAQDDRWIIGRPDEKTMEAVFGIRLSLDQILNAIAGAFEIFDQNDSLPQATVYEDQYVLEALSTHGRKTMWVDGDLFLTTQFAEFDEGGKPMVTGFASRPEPVNGVIIPHLIRIIFPKQRQSTTIAYSSVNVNSEFRKNFSFPNDAVEVQIDTSR